MKSTRNAKWRHEARVRIGLRQGFGFVRQFETWHPLKGGLGAVGGLSSHFTDIAARARALLRDRTLAEVVRAAVVADWMIEEWWWPSERREVVEPPNVEDLRSWYTDLAVLKRTIGSYALDDEQMANGQAFEYFAALALWKVAEVHQAFERIRVPLSLDLLGENALQLHRLRNYSWAAECALEAMEAVCWAEHLNATDTIKEQMYETVAGEQKSLRAHAGGIARGVLYKRVRDEVERWLEENVAKHRKVRDRIDALDAYLKERIKTLPFKCDRSTLVTWERAWRKKVESAVQTLQVCCAD